MSEHSANCPCGAKGIEPEINIDREADWVYVEYTCPQCTHAGDSVDSVAHEERAIESAMNAFLELSPLEEILLSQIADLKARLRLRPMSEAPKDGTNIYVRWQSRHVEGWISSMAYFHPSEKKWRFCGGDERFDRSRYMQAFWQDPSVFELPLNAFEVAE